MAMTGDVLVGSMCEALAEAGAQLSATMRRVGNPGPRAIGTWSIGETARHVASAPGYFLAAARGECELIRLEDVAERSASSLAKDPERDPRVLADRFDLRISRLVSYARTVSGDPDVRPFVGVQVPLSGLLGIELGEVLVHGYDIARAAGLSWRMAPAHAILADEGFLRLLPFLLDKERGGGVRMRLQWRVRGMRPQVVVIHDGALRVQDPSGERVDCTLSADPAVFLLLAWNRIRPWLPLLRGQLAVWGRRPWLAIRFRSLLMRI